MTEAEGNSHAQKSRLSPHHNQAVRFISKMMLSWLRVWAAALVSQLIHDYQNIESAWKWEDSSNIHNDQSHDGKQVKIGATKRETFRLDIFSLEKSLISVSNQEKLVCNIVPLSNVWKPTFARSSGVLRYCYNKKKHLLQIFIATSSIWSQMRIFMTFFTAWIAYTLFRSSSTLQHKT